MKTVIAFNLILGLAWVSKGVLNLARGHGSEYWGDDFVFGGLVLVLGLLGLVRGVRRGRRPDRQVL